jgi:hypothetical protein
MNWRGRKKGEKVKGDKNKTRPVNYLYIAISCVGIDERRKGFAEILPPRT